MADHDDLRRTIKALRTEVPMRPEWRSAVLRDAENLAPTHGVAPTTPFHGWTLRPFAAIAAGVLCAAAGGTLTLGIQHLARQRNAAVAAVEAQPGPHHGAPVRFMFVAPTAAMVAIAGDFNGWSPTATPMRRTAAGLWSIDIPLSAGRHTYAFVVDGRLLPDPNALDSADDDFGVPSSVVLVSEHPRT